MTTTTTTKPTCIASGLPDVGVYIACLASYNNGILHGAWLDLEGDIDEEDIQAGIDWVLATSPFSRAAWLSQRHRMAWIG
jgi:hypothetical protein